MKIEIEMTHFQRALLKAREEGKIDGRSAVRRRIREELLAAILHLTRHMVAGKPVDEPCCGTSALLVALDRVCPEEG